MIHDPIAAKAILLFLGCPEDDIDRTFSDYSESVGARVPARFVDLLGGLRGAMRARGHEPR